MWWEVLSWFSQVASESRGHEGKSERVRVEIKVATCTGRSVENEGSCPWVAKSVVGSSVKGATDVGKGVCTIATEPFSEHGRKKYEV